MPERRLQRTREAYQGRVCLCGRHATGDDELCKDCRAVITALNAPEEPTEETPWAV